MSLPPFPTDEVTLAALRHALGSRLTYEGDVLVRVGADYGVPQLLDFLSGYDPSKVVPVTDEDGFVAPRVVEYVGGEVYSRDDVIAALLDEVERLRGQP